MDMADQDVDLKHGFVKLQLSKRRHWLFLALPRKQTPHPVLLACWGCDSASLLLGNTASAILLMVCRQYVNSM